MSHARRVIAGVLCVSIVFSATSAAAQSAIPVPATASQAAQSNDTTAAGLLEGELLAEGQRTGGKLGAGLAVGVLTGLIGTGIGYFVIGPSPLSPEAIQRSAGRSADFQLGLKTGWEKKTRTKKRNAFLAGGLLGTAAFIALVASARSGQ